MLPDLRIVLAAVVSTFISTVGVGFYASSRLQHESLTVRTDAWGGFDDSPITRIVLSWPEPRPVERNLSLDFAVTHRVSKNPVRDVTHEAQAEGPRPQRTPDTPEATKAATETQVASPGSEKTTIARSLIDDDSPTGSIGDPAPIVPNRPDGARHASLPDAAAEDGATNARGEPPATRIRIVKKPTAKPAVAKARVKKRAPAAKVATPPSPPVTAAQLEFPFLFFSRPSTLN